MVADVFLHADLPFPKSLPGFQKLFPDDAACATHLQAYLNEFTFRFNRRFYPFNAFRSLLGIGGEVAAPTYAALYDGEWEHPTVSDHG